MRRRIVQVMCVWAAAWSGGAAFGQSPFVSGVSPNSAAAGSAAITITVSGGGFNGCSRVRWNAGQPGATDLTTTFVSVASLQATVPAGLLTTQGTVPVGVFIFTQSVTGGCLTTGSAATGTVPFTILPAGPTITSTSPLPTGTVNQAYPPFQFTNSGGTAPFTWSVPSLTTVPPQPPPGMTLNSAGVLSGTPTQTGTFTFPVRVQECTSTQIPGCFARTDTRMFTITIDQFSITTQSLANGSTCLPYSQQMAATGGTSPYTWSAVGLPNALSIGLNTGVISGNVTTAGNFQVTITARESGGRTTSRVYGLVITGTTLQITTQSLPAGRVNVGYSATLVSTGGQTPLSYSLAQGQLPGGVQLSTAGVLSGTPQAAGNFNTTFRVTDAGSCTATRLLPITVNPPDLQILTTQLNPGTVGTAYTQPLNASGGTAPFTWSATGLPQGLTAQATGTITGTPLTAGTFNVTLRVTDSQQQQATRDLTLIVNPPELQITTSSLATANVGVLYTQPLTASGGTTPFVWSGSGLPTGLLVQSNGSIFGTPSVAGTFQVNLVVTDSQQRTATRTLPLTVSAAELQITTSSLAPASVGAAYNQALTASGGTTPFTWSGSGLPAGLTVQSNGAISGTPSVAGTFQVNLVVTDSQQGTATRTLPLTVNAAELQITTSSLAAASVGAAYNQGLTASGGTTPFTWSGSGLPAGLTVQSNGAISGTPSVAGTFQVNLVVTDSQQRTATRTLPLTVNAAELQITTSSLAPASVGAAYNQGLTASGGTTPFTWSGTGLPAGLAVQSGGSIAGTPTVAGSFNVNLVVTDAQQRTATRTLPLTVNPSDLQISTPSLDAGSVNVAYSMLLNATGGSPPYTWTASGLPTLLQMGQGSGLISGTPTQGGSFNVTVQVRDSQQRTATRTYVLQIGSGLTIQTSFLPSGRVGQPYEATLQATGGFGVVTWFAASTFPAGLQLSPGGVVSGTPSQAGDFQITVQARDGAQAQVSKTLALSIVTGLTILTETLPNATTGVLYQVSLAASGGVAPYRWLSLAALPDGLTLDALGSLSGTLQQAGRFNLTFQVTDSLNGSASRDFVLTVVSPFRISTEGLPNGVVGQNYNVTLATTGGRAPVRWGLDAGQLPAGLILNSNTGGLTGIPTASGDFNFTIFAMDADGLRQTKAFSMSVRGGFRFTPDTLPNAIVDAPYSQTFTAVGGTAPVTFTLVAGTLPAGLQLSAAGVLNGTPTATGSSQFTIQAADAGNQTTRQAYTLVVSTPLRITTTALPNGTPGEAYSQRVVTTGGVAPVTFSVVAGTLPGGLTLASATGLIAGTPSVAGSFPFTVQATDAGTQTARQQYTLVIGAGLRITTESLPGASLNVAYRAVVAAEGGAAPLQWSATGLPGGLQINATDGVIAGTPTLSGDFAVTVTVRDSNGVTATKTLALTVAATLSITTATLPDGMVGAVYNQQLAAIGGVGALTWTAGSGLPPGVQLAATGVLSGTPTQAGTFTIAVTVRDTQANTVTRSLALRVAALSLSTVTLQTTGTTGPGNQPGVTLELATGAPVALTGSLSLAFTSDAGGVRDPALRFSQGGDSPQFAVAAGTRQAVFPGGGLNLQLGTVAGTVTVTARFAAGGVDVTPEPAPTQTVRIERTAPVISAMTLARNGNTLTIEISGFSTTRELTSADVQFAVRQGANVQTNTFTVQLNPSFTTWYSSTQSVQFGSAFTLSMPFTVAPGTGATSADITGATVTLVNSVGRSASRNGTF